MQWIAPSEKNSAASKLEKRLWDAADQFRAKGDVIVIRRVGNRKDIYD